MNRRGSAIDTMIMIIGGLVMIGVGACFITYDGGYRAGQIDALNGTWRYDLVTAADGRQHVVELGEGVERE